MEEYGPYCDSFRVGGIIHMSLQLCTSTAMTPEKTFSFRIASSSRWILSLAINERNVCISPTDNEKKGALIQNSCVRSFAGCADLNQAGLLCLVLQVQ